MFEDGDYNIHWEINHWSPDRPQHFRLGKGLWCFACEPVYFQPAQDAIFLVDEDAT